MGNCSCTLPYNQSVNTFTALVHECSSSRHRRLVRLTAALIPATQDLPHLRARSHGRTSQTRTPPSEVQDGRPKDSSPLSSIWRVWTCRCPITLRSAGATRLSRSMIPFDAFPPDPSPSSSTARAHLPETPLVCPTRSTGADDRARREFVDVGSRIPRVSADEFSPRARLPPCSMSPPFRCRLRTNPHRADEPKAEVVVRPGRRVPVAIGAGLLRGNTTQSPLCQLIRFRTADAPRMGCVQ